MAIRQWLIAISLNAGELQSKASFQLQIGNFRRVIGRDSHPCRNSLSKNPDAKLPTSPHSRCETHQETVPIAETRHQSSPKHPSPFVVAHHRRSDPMVRHRFPDEATGDVLWLRPPAPLPSRPPAPSSGPIRCHSPHAMRWQVSGCHLRQGLAGR